MKQVTHTWGPPILAFLLAWQAVLWTFPLAAEEEAPPPLPPDKATFLKSAPKAKEMQWADQKEPAVSVLYGDGGAIGVFNAAGEPLYVERSKGEYDSLGEPKWLPIDGTVVAFCRFGDYPKTSVIGIVLLGLNQDAAQELALPYSRASSYPIEYYHRTWLEDIDKDGKLEVCRFNRHRLECVEWDAEKGKWTWLQEFEGARIEKVHPPVRWTAKAILDRDKKTVELTVEIQSLVDSPLVLETPIAPLFSEGGNWYRSNVTPEAERPWAVVVKTGSNWGHTNWEMEPVGEMRKQLTLPPIGKTTLRFALSIPEKETPMSYFNVRFIGRAMWRQFEVNYLEQYDPLFAGEKPADEEMKHPTLSQCIAGMVPQEAIDQYIKNQVETRKSVSGYFTPLMSDNLRKWLVQRAGADTFARQVLQMDMADETGRLALETLKESKDVVPEDACALLLLALTRVHPTDYKKTIENAGGVGKPLGAALQLVLKNNDPYLDKKALAELLIDSPDKGLAASARDALEKMQTRSHSEQ